MKHSATSDGQYFWASNDSLTHHGIKGQKWGIRRFENEDGSLTDEGYLRYYGHTRKEHNPKTAKLTKKGEKRLKKYTNKVKDNYIKTYNRSADKFNEKIDEINDRKEFRNADFSNGFDSKIGQRYLKEVAKLEYDSSYSSFLEVNGNFLDYGKQMADEFATANAQSIYPKFKK